MKRLFFIFFLILYSISLLGWIDEIKGSWGPMGISLISQSPSNVQLCMSVNKFGMENVMVEGDLM